MDEHELSLPMADAVREGNHNIINMGVFQKGRRVVVQMDPCQQAMAQLKGADIPLYDVDSLERSEQDLKAQANRLREQAQALDQQAEEHGALRMMCVRRDRELAEKGMILENGRIRLVDGDRP